MCLHVWSKVEIVSNELFKRQQHFYIDSALVSTQTPLPFAKLTEANIMETEAVSPYDDYGDP